MKVIRLFIILAFVLTPFVLFAGGTSESGGSSSSSDTGGETGEIDAGQPGMAMSAADQAETGTVGPDIGPAGTLGTGDRPTDTTTTTGGIEAQIQEQYPGSVGAAEAGTIPNSAADIGAEGTMGSGKPGAVLKTIGNNEIRFNDILGYNFGTGKVKDLVLTQDGTVQYIVVNMNNAEGDFLVPPEMVSVASANGGVTATFNFGTGGTGTMTQLQGSAQMGSGAAVPEATFASSLLKYDVVGSDNQKIGKVDDIVFDLQSGKVAYLAMSQGGILGIGENLYAVSFDNAQLDPQNGTIMLNVSANDLKNAKGFDKANWPMQAEIGAQANLGAGAGVQGTAESTTSTTSTTVPLASDNTQPGNTAQPSVNNPQGQEQSSGTK